MYNYYILFLTCTFKHIHKFLNRFYSKEKHKPHRYLMFERPTTFYVVHFGAISKGKSSELYQWHIQKVIKMGVKVHRHQGLWEKSRATRACSQEILKYSGPFPIRPKKKLLCCPLPTDRKMRKKQGRVCLFFLFLKMSDLGEEFAKICIQWPKKALVYAF